MKKYLGLIAMTAVIILAVGIYYIESAVSKSKYPEFIIESNSGDETLVDSLVLKGHYGEHMNVDWLEIDTSGSRYSTDRSYLERLDGLYEGVKMKQLKKDYRSFMRGKASWEHLFYEDEDQLIYGTLKSVGRSQDYIDRSSVDDDFYISMLDKQTNKDVSFTLAIPHADRYMDMYIESVQMFGEELQVITKNHLFDSGATQVEIHIYTFDMENEKILDDEIIKNFTYDENNMYGEIEVLGLENPLTGSENIVWKERVFETKEEDEHYSDKQISEDLFLYDLITKELTTINVPEEINLFEGISLFTGSKIYFSRTNESRLELDTYDIESKSLEEIIFIELSDVSSLENLILNINSDNLYIVPSHINEGLPPPVIVADLATGEVLYEGQITSKDKIDGDFNLDSLDFN